MTSRRRGFWHLSPMISRISAWEWKSLLCPWCLQFTCTVFPAPRTTPFWLKKVEYCSAESKMLHMRHICTFLFFAVNAPQVKHICLTWGLLNFIESNGSCPRCRQYSAALYTRIWTCLRSLQDGSLSWWLMAWRRTEWKYARHSWWWSATTPWLCWTSMNLLCCVFQHSRKKSSL